MTDRLKTQMKIAKEETKKRKMRQAYCRENGYRFYSVDVHGKAVYHK